MTGSTAPTGTITEPATDLCPTPCLLGVADADLDLSAEMGGFFVRVLPDIGGDGAHDLVVEVERDHGATAHRSLRIWPDVLANVAPYEVGSPASDFYDYTGWTIGVEGALPVADMTADGLADVWVQEADDTWRLLPGPITAEIPDPSALSVASVAYLRDPHATDLDGDGVGEVLNAHGDAAYLCEGPFVGVVDTLACPAASVDGWTGLDLLAEGDLDGDGLEEVLVHVFGQPLGEGEALGIGGLQVLDGDFTGGAGARLAIVPDVSVFFDEADVAFDDLDGDGYGDLAWVEAPNYGSSPYDPEIVVVHGPLADGAILGSSDATLRLYGFEEPPEIAVAERGADPPALVLTSVDIDGVLVTDASFQGVADPQATSTFLGSDLTSIHFASVGDVDGDALDDIVVVDDDATGAWLFLGSSLP